MLHFGQLNMGFSSKSNIPRAIRFFLPQGSGESKKVAKVMSSAIITSDLMIR